MIRDLEMYYLDLGTRDKFLCRMRGNNVQVDVSSEAAGHGSDRLFKGGSRWSP